MPDSPMSTKNTLQFFTHALKAFSSSQDAFRVLSTVPRPSTLSPPTTTATDTTPSSALSARKPCRPVKQLVILDSSFNPPTTAHAQMAASAVESAGPGARLMLLLAVNNADKGVVPAAFEMRLGMMEGFARELVALYQRERLEEIQRRNRGSEGIGHGVDGEGGADDMDGDGGLEIDLAVTTMPFFHEKSSVISESGIYDGAEQMFLCGFDTVIRIFNPKYYNTSPTSTTTSTGIKHALSPFFNRARLRVTIRPDDEWGTRSEQASYVERLENGELEKVGGDGAWARRIDLVDGLAGPVSSSKVREAVGRHEGGDVGGLDGLVGGEVRRWIEVEGLYR